MIEIPIWIFVVMCIAVLLLLYISFVQYRRADRSSEVIDTLINNMQTIHDFISEASERLGDSNLRAAFESDDEVGFFFKEIQEIQNTLSTFVENEETSTDVK